MMAILSEPQYINDLHYARNMPKQETLSSNPSVAGLIKPK